ncbi:hypothetical protein ACQ4M4_20725 [Leptolyngbya sp. AN02str]|uniref:hypothetical protein n=1 Tax=Leptolyngbya sp. AN02str TaxID=3423363 RepID=UPI003D320B89
MHLLQYSSAQLLRSLVYHVCDLVIYVKCMSSQYDVSSVYSVFNNLLQDLEGFVDPNQLEIVFDTKKQAFLCGPGFREQLTANPTLAREIRKEMRDILAKHLGRHVTG